MVIFIDTKYTPTSIVKHAIPMERVFEIRQYGCSVSVYFFDGEKMPIEGVWVDKVSEEKIVYDSEKDAVDAMKNFYKACFQNRNAFYFGINSNSNY